MRVSKSACKMASRSASLLGAPPSTIAMCSEGIVWYPCTPSSTRKTCVKIIALRLVPIRDSGFTEEDEEEADEEYDDIKIVKSRSSRFSRAKVEAGTEELGLFMARYESVVLAGEFSRPSQTFSPSLEAFFTRIT